MFSCVKESLQTATACKKCLASLACCVTDSCSFCECRLCFFVRPSFNSNSFAAFLNLLSDPKGVRPYSCFSPSSSSSPPSPPAIKPIVNKTSVFRRFQHSNQHFIHRRKEDSTGVHLEKTNTTTKTNTKTNTRTKTK